MAREATLSVSLTNQLRAYVHSKVESGQYESASEVVRQSLRSMQEQEQHERLYWSEVRRKVKESRDAIAAGDVIDGPAFMRDKIARLTSRSAGKKPSVGRKKRP